jgi:hypothetical protein
VQSLQRLYTILALEVCTCCRIIRQFGVGRRCGEAPPFGEAVPLSAALRRFGVVPSLAEALPCGAVPQSGAAAAQRDLVLSGVARLSGAAAPMSAKP